MTRKLKVSTMKIKYNSGKKSTNKYRLGKLIEILSNYIDDVEVLDIGCYRSKLLHEYIK